VILPSRPRRCVARRLTAAGIFLLGLAGCATPQLQALLGSDPSGIPQRAEIGAVPFYPQDDYQCGPAALAMVLGAGGKAIEPEALRPQVYLPDRHGSLQVEMLAAARRNGFVAIELKPKLADLLTRSPRETPCSCCRTLRWTCIRSGTTRSRSAMTSRRAASPCAPAKSGACRCRSAPSSTPGDAAAIGRCSRCRREACRRACLQATI